MDLLTFRNFRLGDGMAIVGGVERSLTDSGTSEVIQCEFNEGDKADPANLLVRMAAWRRDQYAP